MSQKKFTTNIIKGKVKAGITEDTFTDYLVKLQENLETQKKPMIYNLMRSMVGEPFQEDSGFIAPNMSKWNPYLYISGQLDAYWEGEDSEGIITLDTLYTGMHIHTYYKVLGGLTNSSTELPKGIWWEFATFDTWGKPPEERKLRRDYAEFQETGKDPEGRAKPSMARHKHGIRKGIRESESALMEEAQTYLNMIIELEKVPLKHHDRPLDSIF